MVHADRNTPGFMRAPPETPYMFALECAMDEWPSALNRDPIELRRINDTAVDPIDRLPFTSRSLMECFNRAADVIRMENRDPKPGSMREGEWLIGWGCASAVYPANIGAAMSGFPTIRREARPLRLQPMKSAPGPKRSFRDRV